MALCFFYVMDQHTLFVMILTIRYSKHLEPDQEERSQTYKGFLRKRHHFVLSVSALPSEYRGFFRVSYHLWSCEQCAQSGKQDVSGIFGLRMGPENREGMLVFECLSAVVFERGQKWADGWGNETGQCHCILT